MIQALKKSHLIWTLVLFFWGYPYWIPPFLCYKYIFWVLSISSCELVTFQKNKKLQRFQLLWFGAQTCLETNLKVTSVSQLVFEIRWSSPKKLRKRRASFLRARRGCVCRGGVHEPWRGSNWVQTVPHVSICHPDAGAWFWCQAAVGQFPVSMVPTSGWEVSRPRALYVYLVNANMDSKSREVEWWFVMSLLYFFFASFLHKSYSLKGKNGNLVKGQILILEKWWTPYSFSLYWRLCYPCK